MSIVPIRDAVTAVLCHAGDIFLVRRQISLTAFPGYHAFPGGKVDEADGFGEAGPSAIAVDIEPRLWRALARELKEELDFNLDVACATGDVEYCIALATAVTPSFAPLRFRAHFFRIDLRQRPDFRLDPGEIDSGSWASASEWMHQYNAGELLLAPPTWLALKAMTAEPTTRALSFGDFEAQTFPILEPQRGLRQLLVSSNTIRPAQHTNCFLIGDESAHRILVDPSPNSRQELDRLKAVAGEIGFHEVFLTHHHPDHREFADVLAREVGVPIGMSADTQARIRRLAPHFFYGLTVKTYVDGDVVTQWLGHPVRVMAVPGHDEGQLALMPDNRAWCIVSDLIQGIGTVVIAAPEGDMRKYFASLERVIAVAPRVIYPSHGMGLGGVFYLEQTLRHRRQREAQIKTMVASGRTIDDMLTEIYRDVSPYLLPLARMNIESHLAKLRSEATAG